MATMKRVCAGVCVAVGVVVGVVGVLLLVATIRALTIQDIDYQEDALDLGPLEEMPEWYMEKLPGLMSAALRIPTVSLEKGNYDRQAMLTFHQFLREEFAGVFNSTFITTEVVNNYSLLFTVQGSNTNLTPYLLMSHIDVVPAVKEMWTYDPFGGEIHPDPVTGEDSVWGRGAIDAKLGVMGMMMALNYLTLTDFQPTRSFYVAFGHDEEVHGEDGAKEIAKLMTERNIEVEFIVDEGIPVLEGVMAGIDNPLASIGVTEKGWMMVKVEAEGEGGHSSMPPKNSAVSRLASAVHKLESYPQPSMFGKGPEADMFAYIAPKAAWPQKLVFANTWLFKPLLELVMSSSRETNAMVRTTTSTTIVRAGVKSNVVPSSAQATVNHRIHPAQSIQEVLEYDNYIINDPTVKVRMESGLEAFPVSPYGPDVAAWRFLTAAIHHHFPGAITAPGILVGNTDTYHYVHLTKAIYRFFPVVLRRSHLSTIHGHDERMSLANLKAAAGFYRHFVLLADGHAPSLAPHTGHRAGEL